jgi:glutamate synthase domain-containing protein 3
MDLRQLNDALRENLGKDAEIVVENPHSMHNVGTALIGEGTIRVKGATGFYTGGFLEGPSLIIEGNTGWYSGDNMLAGELIIEQHAGSNCAPSMIGGNLIVRGSTGSRCGFGLKGGNVIVCGDVGRWCGQMTLGGRIIVLGKVGKGLGESMYKGLIHVADPEAESKLGGNVEFGAISDEDVQAVGALFEQYAIDADPTKFMTAYPMTTGRHKYTIFQPSHLQEAR